MLAEIFMLRIEALTTRTSNEPGKTAADPRFVPVSLPKR